MRATTHRRLVRAVLARLNVELSQGSINRLVNLVARLDERARPRIKHHEMYNVGTIWRYIKSARMDYLGYTITKWARLEDSMVYYLGVALHLAHDALVPSPRYEKKLHDRIEAALAKRKVPVEEIRRVLACVKSPHVEAFEVLGLLTPHDDPEKALRTATVVTTKILYAVLGPVEPPPDVTERVKEFRRRVEEAEARLNEVKLKHEVYVHRANIVGLTILSIALLASILLVFIHLISMSSIVLLISLIVTLVARVMILRRDEEYYSAKKIFKDAKDAYKNYMKSDEVTWYRLKG